MRSLLFASVFAFGGALAAHAQALDGINVGDPASATDRLGKPSAVNTGKDTTTKRWSMPNGNTLSVTTSNSDDTIVYVEKDWGTTVAGSFDTDVSGLTFGRSTLDDVRHVFGSNGFSFPSHAVVPSEDGAALFNCYEVQASSPRALCLVTDLARKDDEEIDRDKIGRNALLDAVIVADPRYLRTVWGRDTVADPSSHPVRWDDARHGPVTVLPAPADISPNLPPPPTTPESTHHPAVDPDMASVNGSLKQVLGRLRGIDKRLDDVEAHIRHLEERPKPRPRPRPLEPPPVPSYRPPPVEPEQIPIAPPVQEPVILMCSDLNALAELRRQTGAISVYDVRQSLSGAPCEARLYTSQGTFTVSYGARLDPYGQVVVSQQVYSPPPVYPPPPPPLPPPLPPPPIYPVAPVYAQPFPVYEPPVPVYAPPPAYPIGEVAGLPSLNFALRFGGGGHNWGHSWGHSWGHNWGHSWSGGGGWRHR